MAKIMDKIIKHQKFTQADFIEDMQEFINSGKADEIEIKEVNLTMNGGSCPFCSKPWKLVQKREKFSEYDYFVACCSCLDKSKSEIDYMQEEIRFNEAASIPKIYHKVSLKNIDRKIRSDTLKTIDSIIDYAKADRYLQKGLILFGNDSGTGKTMLTISLMKRMAIKHKKSALFVDCSKIDAEILRDNYYLFSLLDKDIVLLDDIEKSSLGRTNNDWSLQKFFTIINVLCENKKTIFITSNLDTKKEFIDTYSKYYDDKIIGRLTEACEFMRIAGDNYRMKDKENFL